MSFLLLIYFSILCSLICIKGAIQPSLVEEPIPAVITDSNKQNVINDINIKPLKSRHRKKGKSKSGNVSEPVETTTFYTVHTVTDYFHDEPVSPYWFAFQSRPIPPWYDLSKIGILIHWGLYSVPSVGSDWYWFGFVNQEQLMKNYTKQNRLSNFKYKDFAPKFKAEFFNAKKWAKLFVKSGARYVILTAKNYDGFSLYKTNLKGWNTVDVGPRRDLIKAVADAVRNAGLRFGIYYCLSEWFDGMYRTDKKNNFESKVYPNLKVWPDIQHLVLKYKPSVFWSDGDEDANENYWNSTNIIAWMYNESPVRHEIVVNDRWGSGTQCINGDFYNCGDGYNPRRWMKHKWENTLSLDKKSLSFRRDMKIGDVLTINEILDAVVSTVSCGGNVLINIGPTSEGTIVPIFQERLLQLGDWLSNNGEAIYGTSPWVYQNDSLNPHVWYTCRHKMYEPLMPTFLPQKNQAFTAVYAIFLQWPINDTLRVSSLAWYCKRGVTIELLGAKEKHKLDWRISKDVVEIDLPDLADMAYEYAWTLKIKQLPVVIYKKHKFSEGDSDPYVVKVNAYEDDIHTTLNIPEPPPPESDEAEFLAGGPFALR